MALNSEKDTYLQWESWNEKAEHWLNLSRDNAHPVTQIFQRYARPRMTTVEPRVLIVGHKIILASMRICKNGICE